jgi:hypothetical protein
MLSSLRKVYEFVLTAKGQKQGTLSYNLQPTAYSLQPTAFIYINYLR